MIAHTQVRKISYVCHRNGDIDPYVHIVPLSDPAGGEVSSFPLKGMSLVGTLTPTTGDKISITVLEDPTVMPVLQITEHSALPRRNLLSGICPICGDVLHTPVGPYSIGRCWNRNCCGSLHSNLIHYLTEIGVPFNESTIRVLRCIAGRNSIYSLPGIYRLHIEDLDFVYVSPMDARIFLMALHGLRGRVSPATLIKALRIPDWTFKDYQAFEEYCMCNQISLQDLISLVQGEDPTCGTCNWSALKAFFAHQTNLDILRELSFILTI